MNGIGGPKGMDPKIVKTLHDAFKKGLDDPEFIKIMERYDQVRSYLNTEDYKRGRASNMRLRKSSSSALA